MSETQPLLEDAGVEATALSRTLPGRNHAERTQRPLTESRLIRPGQSHPVPRLATTFALAVMVLIQVAWAAFLCFLAYTAWARLPL